MDRAFINEIRSFERIDTDNRIDNNMADILSNDTANQSTKERNPTIDTSVKWSFSMLNGKRLSLDKKESKIENND